MTIMKRKEKKIIIKVFKRALKRILKESYYIIMMLIFILKSQNLM